MSDVERSAFTVISELDREVTLRWGPWLTRRRCPLGRLGVGVVTLVTVGVIASPQASAAVAIAGAGWALGLAISMLRAVTTTVRISAGRWQITDGLLTRRTAISQQRPTRPPVTDASLAARTVTPEPKRHGLSRALLCLTILAAIGLIVIQRLNLIR